MFFNIEPVFAGVILRDSHGVAQVRFVTGNKILRILKAKGLAPVIPEDLYYLIKKAVAIRKHLERNRKVYLYHITYAFINFYFYFIINCLMFMMTASIVESIKQLSCALFVLFFMLTFIWQVGPEVLCSRVVRPFVSCTCMRKRVHQPACCPLLVYHTHTHPGEPVPERYKKLSYRRGTARCFLSVVILPITTHTHLHTHLTALFPGLPG